MTRPVATEIEVRARQAILDYFKDDSISFVDRGVNDAPDLLFNHKNDLICVEVTQIPGSEIIQYYHKLFEDLRIQDGTIRAVEVIYATEPHSWVINAVLKKRKKIVHYKKNTNAKKAWLLLHAPLEGLDNPFNEFGTTEIALLKYGATSVPNGFDRIFFLRKDGQIVALSRHGQRFPKPVLNIKQGYPSSAVTMFTPLKLVVEDSGERTWHHSGDVFMDTIVVPPMDPEFRNHLPFRKRRAMKITPIENLGGTQMQWNIVERDW